MASRLKIDVVRLAHAKGLSLPKYQTEGSAGFDLEAALAPGERICLRPGMRQLIPTGLIFAIPEEYEGQIRPRSGLALKSGVTVLNSPGTIDNDYRGELCVLLINHGQEDFIIERGMRIAQMVIAPMIQAEFEEVCSLETTARAQRGFGSTGI